MHLVCHETIPGSGYVRGQVVTDPAAIAEIKANDGLMKHFSQVPDGTFPDAATASPTRPISTPVPAPSAS